ncbi:hypothetical protein T265_14987, partial [Opisthorchis viverrini]
MAVRQQRVLQLNDFRSCASNNSTQLKVKNIPEEILKEADSRRTSRNCKRMEPFNLSTCLHEPNRYSIADLRPLKNRVVLWPSMVEQADPHFIVQV